jgi:ATP-dependent Clp protease ATP-binding subunit ClpA
MFERFTERARQAVVLAQDEARALGHGYIGTEHLVLGILREGEGRGAVALAALGVTDVEVRERVTRIDGRGDEIPTGQIAFTPHLKRTLELSLREALSLGHNHIGTEHLLLGLVRDNEGVGSQVLLEMGVDAETVRREVVRMLSGPQILWHGADDAYQEAFVQTQSSSGWTGYAPIPQAEAAAEVKPLPGNEPMLLRGILVGWTLFGLASGIGLLVGWLIWG